MEHKTAVKKGGLKNPPFFIELILIPLLMAVLIGWFFKDALFSGQIFVERDISRYYYPLRYFAVNCIKSGVFPLWNPYIFCGNPLFASLQSAVLYPLSVIYYLGEFAKMFNIFVAIHFALAGIFTYAFLRHIQCSVFAGLLSAGTFALSGYLVSVVNLLTTLSVVSWFPLAVLVYYKMTKAGGYANAVALGAVFTVMFLGGEPSVLYVTAGLFFCGSMYFTAEEFIEKRRLNVNYIAGMLLALIVFLGLSAFQLLPFVEFLKMSSRDRITFEMASIWNLPLGDMPGVLLPFFHDIFKLFANYWQRQSWLDNYYVGILAFLLFIIGVIFDRSKKARAIFIFGLIGLFLSLGKNTVLFELLYKFLPGFKVIRYSVRFFFIPTFAICALAGMGLDYYIKFAKKDSRLQKAVFLILALAFFSAIAFWMLYFNFKECFYFIKSLATKLIWRSSMPRLCAEDIVNSPLFSRFIEADLINLKRAFFLLASFGILFYLGIKKGVRANLFIAPALVFLAVTDVFGVSEGLNPLFDIKKFTAPGTNAEFLMKEQKRLRNVYPGDLNKQLFRICCSPQTAREHAYVPEQDFYKGLEASKDRLITNRTIEFGIYDASMYGSIYIRRNSRFMTLVVDKRSKNLPKLLKLLNVKYVASPKDPETIDFMLVNKSEAANLYETDEYLPRAFLAEKAVVINDEEEIIAKLREGEFDPANEVILEEYIPPAPAGPQTGQPPVQPSGAAPRRTQYAERAPEAVRIVSYKPNEAVIEADVIGGPKFLVLADTWYPGWKVFVNGRRQRLLRADYIFRAVYLEPGRHVVKFAYRPFSFKAGIIISLFTGLIILTFALPHNIIRLLK